jgi:hypothetical protein
MLKAFIRSSALALTIVTSTTASFAAAEPVAPIHPLAQRYLGETLILNTEEEVAIALMVNRNGTVSYIDIHYYKNGLNNSYVRTVPFEIRDDNTFCVMKETQPCFDIMELKASEPKDVNIKEYKDGKVAWTGKGQLMLVAQRHPFVHK